MGCVRALLLLLVIMVGACRPEAAPQRTGGTVVVAAGADLDQMNSLVAGERYTQEVNSFMLFLPLLQLDADLNYVPALAEGWDVEGDSTITFRIRRGVRWHDGAVTSAYDVLFTWQRARDPETAFPRADEVRQWTHAEVVDSFTIRFRLEPHLDALGGFPLLPIMPEHLLRDVPPALMRQAPFNRQPIGNGPFRFAEFRAGERSVFVANEEFPQELGGPPSVDRIVFRTIPEATAQVTELLTGGADMVLSPRSDDFVDMVSRPGIYGITRPGRQYVSIWWNGRRSPFGEPAFRRAATMAIDRDRLVNALRGGYGEPIAGPVLPHHWAHDSGIRPLPHAPDQARALLDGLGMRASGPDGVRSLPDGRALRVVLKIPAGSALNRDMAELIRHELALIGVRVEVRPLDISALVQDFTGPDRNFDAVLMAWSSGLRLNLRDNFHSAALAGPHQFAGYRSAAVDSLIDRLERVTTRDEATPLYRDIQRILRDEQPWSFLYAYPDLVLAAERLKGVDMDVRGALVGVARWRVVEGAP
jgi:peptide/nickel transport system substrate-binding protein